MKNPMKPLTAKALFASAAVAVAVFSATAPAPAYADYGSSGSLYYRMGGESPGGRANYESQVAANLGVGATLRLNYSCGKFDLSYSWKVMLNSLKNLGSKIQSALYAGIANLPMYILMRAQPGLYQLFQTYSAQADTLIAAALKTCEEFEAQIRNGENPYEDWIKLAKGNAWKGKIKIAGSNTGTIFEYDPNTSTEVEQEKAGDIISAKEAIEKKEKGQKEGIPWVFGKNAGGLNSDPIQPIRDLSIAGYNATLGKPTTADPKASSTGTDSRLTRAFPSAQSLSDFTTATLGDTAVRTCSPGDNGCTPSTTTVTATGLGPKLEEEYNEVQPKLAELASGSERGATAQTKLEEIGTEGYTVNGALLETLRRLPAEERAAAVERLSQELAMHRIVNKALVARAVLLTGLSLPEVTAAGHAMRETQAQIDRLTQYIDDLLYESRIRRELTSNTALAIMEHQSGNEAAAASVAPARLTESNRLQGGGFVSDK